MFFVKKINILCRKSANTQLQFSTDLIQGKMKTNFEKIERLVDEHGLKKNAEEF